MWGTSLVHPSPSRSHSGCCCDIICDSACLAQVQISNDIFNKTFSTFGELESTYWTSMERSKRKVAKAIAKWKAPVTVCAVNDALNHKMLHRSRNYSLYTVTWVNLNGLLYSRQMCVLWAKYKLNFQNRTWDRAPGSFVLCNATVISCFLTERVLHGTIETCSNELVLTLLFFCKHTINNHIHYSA